MRSDEVLNKILVFGILGLLTFTALIRIPLHLLHAVIVLSVIFLLLIYCLKVGSGKTPISLKLPFVIPVCLFIGLIVFQLLPLTAPGLRFISPHTLQLYREALCRFGTSSGLKTNLSIYTNSTGRELSLLLAYCALFYLTANSFANPKSRKKAMATIILIGCVCAVSGPITLRRGLWFQSQNTILSAIRGATWFSSLRYQAHFVGFLEAAFFVGLGFFPQYIHDPGRVESRDGIFSRRTKAIGAGLIALALLVSPFLSTYARSPLLVYPVILLFMAGLSRVAPIPSPQRVLPILFLLLCLLTAIAFSLWTPSFRKVSPDQTELAGRMTQLRNKTEGILPGLHDREKDTGDYFSGKFDRIDIYRDTLRLAGQFPVFGIGLGNFKILFPAYKTSYSYHRLHRTHNEYLELLAETGLAGFTLMGIVAALFILAVGKYLRYSSLPFIGCLAALGAILLEGTFTFPFENPAVVILTLLLTGLIFAEIPLRSIKIRLKSRWKKIGCGLILLIIFALWGRTAIKTSRAESHYRSGDQEEGAEALRELQEAVLLDGGNAEYHADLADCYWNNILEDPFGAAVWKKEAARQLQEAVRLNPLEATLHYRLGRIYEETGENDTAGREFRIALSLWPTHPVFLCKMARLYLDSREEGIAVDMYRRAVRIKPSLLEKALSELFEATHNYIALKEITPRKRKYYLELHRFLQENNEPEMAEAIAKSVRRDFPDQ